MKNNLPSKKILATICLIWLTCIANAQPAPPPPAMMDPRTGLPINAPTAPAMMDPRTGLSINAPTSAAIDPTTGLPAAQAQVSWKDPDWQDPDKILDSVHYDGLPVSEVAKQLRETFTNDFDIILPYDSGMHPADFQAIDWTQTSVNLELRHVTASEVFNAMNMLFENNRTPLQWQLTMNGKRRTAILRVLQDPPPNSLTAQPQSKAVFYVGDLVGENQTTGDFVDEIEGIWRLADHNNRKSLQYHQEAQLIIVTGTDDDIKLVHQILEALQAKKQADRAKKIEATQPPKPDPYASPK